MKRSYPPAPGSRKRTAGFALCLDHYVGHGYAVRAMESLPAHLEIRHRWRLERSIKLLFPVLLGLVGLMVLVGVALLVFPLGSAVLLGAGAALLLGLVVAGGVLLSPWMKEPPTKSLALRADQALGLPDDLLASSEMAMDSAGWAEAVRREARRHVDAGSIPRRWKLEVPTRVRWVGGATAVAACAVLALFIARWIAWEGHQAELAAARAERIEAAADVLADWEEFSELTEDAELREFFREAAALREALENPDAMEAMREMNAIEEAISALEAVLEAQSMEPHVGALAEAIEGIPGLASASAALRRENFSAAAEITANRADQIEKSPTGKTPIQRAAVAADQMASEARNAASRGNPTLANAFDQLARSAAESAKSGATPNNQLAPALRSLCQELQKESACRGRGAALALSRAQLDALRRRLRGEPCPSGTMPSLCQSLGTKPGGQMAGSGTDGNPLGEATELAQATTLEHVQGMPGQGETEVRTVSADTGTTSATGPGREAAFAEYVELSERAVADESLPLAHRGIIRTYFEKIRPLASETAEPATNLP